MINYWFADPEELRKGLEECYAVEKAELERRRQEEKEMWDPGGKLEQRERESWDRFFREMDKLKEDSKIE